ncbi:MAG: prenyltransferase [Nitrososphaerales archaeon]|nr:prenyltransferase [Nitrososphaerales archaeon]
MPAIGRLFVVTGPWSFAMSFVAITVGTFVAGGLRVDPLLYFLSLAMVVPIHAGANLLNDCYDVITGADKPGALVLKPHPILSGILSLKSTLLYAAILMALGIAAGIGLYALGRPYSLVVASAAVALMLCYNVPPLRLKDRGLGELLVFLVWGPLIFLGSFYLQSDTFASMSVVYSVPIGLLVASVLLIDDIRDIEEDTSIGRVTIPILLGKERALRLYLWFIASSYIIVALFGVYFGRPLLLLVLLSAPASLALAKRFKTELPRVAPDKMAAKFMILFGLLYAVAIAI